MSEDARALWQLQPVAVRARVFMVLLCTLPLLAGVILAGRSWLAGVLGVAGAIVLAWLLDWLMRRHRVRVDATGLEVVTSLYRRRLAWPELRLDAARVIAIDEHPERKPRFKTNGMATFGFRGGWFRSRDRTKLFVAMTDGKRLLWLPTTQGFTLLLEPRKAQALLDRLRELAPPPPRG